MNAAESDNLCPYRDRLSADPRDWPKGFVAHLNSCDQCSAAVADRIGEACRGIAARIRPPEKSVRKIVWALCRRIIGRFVHCAVQAMAVLQPVPAMVIVASLLAVGGTQAYYTGKRDALAKELEITNAALRKVEANERKAREELARLEQAHPVKTPTIDERRAEFERGMEFTLRATDPATFKGQIAIVPPVEFRPPNFVALDVQWSNEKEKAQRMIHFGYIPTPVVLTHQYQVETGETTPVQLTLRFLVSHKAAEEFKLDSYEIVKTFPLLLSSDGVRLRTEGSRTVGICTIDNIPEGEPEHPSEFVLRFTVAPPAEPLPPSSDRVVQVLTRPLNGLPGLQQVYTVQRFKARVSELPRLVKQSFETRIDVLANGGKATRYEILVVELGFDWPESELPKAMLDFDDEAVRASTVIAKRTVYVPSAEFGAARE